MWNDDDWGDWDDDIPSADDLLRMCHDAVDKLPKEPATHSPNQCFSFEDLEVGGTYIEVYEDFEGSIVQIVSDPYLNDINVWAVDVYVTGDFGEYFRSICLTDKGIMPYSNGGWNQTNYLVRLD